VQIGKYYKLEEFTDSQTATRFGLDNTPDANAVEALRALCANVLDPLREMLGRPIRITSGYRAPRVNRAIGGSPNSQHMAGEAADIKVDGLTAAQLFDFIRASDLPFDQLILEFGRWAHVSYSTSQRRQHCLVASKSADGHTRYQTVARRPAVNPASAIRERLTETIPVAPPPSRDVYDDLKSVMPQQRAATSAPLSLAERITDALFGSGKRETQWALSALLAWPLWNQLAEVLTQAGVQLPTKGQVLTGAIALLRLFVLRGTK
jgi:hypothetical protein